MLCSGDKLISVPEVFFVECLVSFRLRSKWQFSFYSAFAELHKSPDVLHKSHISQLTDEKVISHATFRPETSCRVEMKTFKTIKPAHKQDCLSPIPSTLVKNHEE